MGRKPAAEDDGRVTMTNEAIVTSCLPSIFCFRRFEDTRPYAMSEEEFRNSEVLTTTAIGEVGYFSHQVIHAGRIVKVLQCPADALDPLMAMGVQG